MSGFLSISCYLDLYLSICLTLFLSVYLSLHHSLTLASLFILSILSGRAYKKLLYNRRCVNVPVGAKKIRYNEKGASQSQTGAK
jgi:hypothetical protein